jgi:hypothetical protein
MIAAIANPRTLLTRTKHLVHGLLFKTGLKQWRTKSFEFWTFLTVLLVIVRPRSIVELGSGRSTSYLTEYALKEGILYASIEQNRFYAAKIKRGLRNSFLSDRYLHHVPIAADGWYQMDALNRVTNFPCEFLFVDGPVGIQDPRTAGRRNCERSLPWLKTAAATSKVVMADDVHYRSNFDMFHELMGESQRLSTLYLSYHVQPNPNVIAVAVDSAFYDTLTRVCGEIGIKFFTDYSMAQCSQP